MATLSDLRRAFEDANDETLRIERGCERQAGDPSADDVNSQLLGKQPRRNRIDAELIDHGRHGCFHGRSHNGLSDCYEADMDEEERLQGKRQVPWRGKRPM